MPLIPGLDNTRANHHPFVPLLIGLLIMLLVDVTVCHSGRLQPGATRISRGADFQGEIRVARDQICTRNDLKVNFLHES